MVEQVPRSHPPRTLAKLLGGRVRAAVVDFSNSRRRISGEI